jgi:hypothetical protein
MPSLTRTIASRASAGAGAAIAPARGGARARRAPQAPRSAAAEAAPAAASPPADAPVNPKSGLRHLGPAGRANATNPKANPIEKKKNAKSGAEMWTEGERWR